MKFQELELAGLHVIDPEKISDERGFLARTFCAREFEARGLHTSFVQCSVSLSQRRGTLRGLHLQIARREEAKLIRCTRGSLYDVLVDLRASSDSYGRWTAIVLSASNPRLLYIPPGLAHGFQTLEDDTEVFYQMSAFHAPDCEYGVRWNDPSLQIEWPLEPTVISPKDQSFSDLVLQRGERNRLRRHH
jgi:dTDP-4-dehydrorhamnose 3,5-epimerase